MTPAKLHLAKAAMRRPGTEVAKLCAELGITRQTLYLHVPPKGEIRPDDGRLLAQRAQRARWRSIALPKRQISAFD
jgi:hypothetical protein